MGREQLQWRPIQRAFHSEENSLFCPHPLFFVPLLWRKEKGKLELESYLYISSEADYKMYCVGYWKENLKSYLITYDQLDAFTKYRCWVRSILVTNVLSSASIVKYICDFSCRSNCRSINALT